MASLSLACRPSVDIKHIHRFLVFVVVRNSAELIFLPNKHILNMDFMPF